MRRIIQGAFLALSLLGDIPAQTSSSKPDCVVTQRFTAASPGTAFSNKPTAASGTSCNYWSVTYWTNGASSVSVKVEGAADSAGAPTGSYTTLTATTGANPATGANQGSMILCCDYFPWLRINPTSFNGTQLVIRLYGWRRQQ